MIVLVLFVTCLPVCFGFCLFLLFLFLCAVCFSVFPCISVSPIFLFSHLFPFLSLYFRVFLLVFVFYVFSEFSCVSVYVCFYVSCDFVCFCCCVSCVSVCFRVYIEVSLLKDPPNLTLPMINCFISMLNLCFFKAITQLSKYNFLMPQTIHYRIALTYKNSSSSADNTLIF